VPLVRGGSLADRSAVEDAAVWSELFKRVDQVIDGEVFRCIELLSLKEQSKVAQLVRSLLVGQLERARAAAICASSVVENWHRVVGNLDSELLAMARSSAVAPALVTATLATPSASSGGAPGKKRRRTEFAAQEDEDEFLRLAEAGDATRVMALLQASANPRRLLSCRSE
ncbi:unnamed protein product, partial [Polarella glacialis]